MPTSESNRFQDTIHSGYNRLKKGAPVVALVGVALAGCASPGNTVNASPNEGSVATSTVTPPAQETVKPERPSDPNAEFIQLTPEEYQEFSKKLWEPALIRINDIIKNSTDPEGSQGNSRSHFLQSSNNELIFYREGADMGYGDRGIVEVGSLEGLNYPELSYITVTIENPSVGACRVGALNPDFRRDKEGITSIDMVKGFFEKSDNIRIEGAECGIPSRDGDEYFVIRIADGKITGQTGPNHRASLKEMEAVKGEDNIRGMADQVKAFFDGQPSA